MTAGVASPYGSTYRRAAAAGIDGAIISVIQFAMWLGVPAVASALGLATWHLPAGLTMAEEWGLALLASAAIGVVYRTVYDASPWQATPGRRALSLKVCTVDGERLGAGRAFVRALSREFGMLLLAIGALPFLWTPRRQAAHDLLAGSVVVLDRVTPPVAAAAAPERGLPRGGWMLILHVVTLVPTVIGLWFAMPTIEQFMARQQVEAASGEAMDQRDYVVARYDEGAALEDINSEPGEEPPGKWVKHRPGALPEWLESRTHEVSISHGVVIISFPEDAAAPLRGKQLAWVPAVAEDGTLRWACGRAPPPLRHTTHPADAASLTDIDDAVLPEYCRADAEAYDAEEDWVRAPGEDP